VRGSGVEDPVHRDLATSIGLDEDALARLMSEIGFTKAGDAWRWRGRRGERPDRRPARSHAFAELAKLKKK
jgi:ATP-dependent RNA helicase SUPV3L1/SUV3